MNLATLRTRVRAAVLERATDVGLISGDPEANDWINAANRAVFNQAVEWNPRPWIERSGDVVYAGPLLLATLAGGGAPVKSVHLLAVKVGSGYEKITPSEEGYLDDSGLDPLLAVASASPSRWFVEGQGIWLAPAPGAAPTLKAWFVRQLVDLAADVDVPLGGLFLDHHDLIVYKAAQLLYRKDEMILTPWDKDVDEGLRVLRSALARNQGQRTRRIRPASHFPNIRRRR